MVISNNDKLLTLIYEAFKLTIKDNPKFDYSDNSIENKSSISSKLHEKFQELASKKLSNKLVLMEFNKSGSSVGLKLIDPNKMMRAKDASNIVDTLSFLIDWTIDDTVKIPNYSVVVRLFSGRFYAELVILATSVGDHPLNIMYRGVHAR
jgi:hypothetical protein